MGAPAQARFCAGMPSPAIVCGKPANQVDHVLPVGLGGEDEASNLRAICGHCHERKSAQEYGQIRKRTWRIETGIRRALDSGVCQDCGGRGEVVRRVNPTGAIESANMVTLCRRCSDKRDARRRIERETDAGAKAWMLEVERVRAKNQARTVPASSTLVLRTR